MDKRNIDRRDWFVLSLITAVGILVYFPVMTARYVYADEATQLWNYRPGSGYHMFIEQGRTVTDWLFTLLFNRIDRIDQLRYLRLFSLAGWIILMPAWFTILKRIFIREHLPLHLIPMLILWLLVCPTVIISIGWASCLELVIAYSFGLFSGYLAYLRLGYDAEERQGSAWMLPLSLLAGLVSLFTYQNGFGLFMLPFMLHALGSPGRFQKVIKGLIFFLLITGVYYLLFKMQLHLLGIAPNERTSIGLNPVRKIVFFFTRPLAAAMQVGVLFNERGKAGFLVYLLVLGFTLLLYFRLLRSLVIAERLKQLGILFTCFLFAYLPSLLVKENFASNRTLLALSFSVFTWILLVIDFTEKATRKEERRSLLLINLELSLVAGIIMNGYFNYNNGFRRPLQREYLAIQSAVGVLFKPGSVAPPDSIALIRPAETLFTDKYQVTRSWDEFGIPSLFFQWVPDPFVRQVIYEERGLRTTQQELLIRTVAAEDSAMAGTPFVIDARHW